MEVHICCELLLLQATSNNCCIVVWTIVSTCESGSCLEHGTGVAYAHAMSLWVMHNTCLATRKANPKQIKQIAGNCPTVPNCLWPDARHTHTSPRSVPPLKHPQTFVSKQILFLPFYPPCWNSLALLAPFQPRSNPSSVCRSWNL